MRYETIAVTQVTPRIGANVEGVTLAKPLPISKPFEAGSERLRQHGLVMA